MSTRKQRTWRKYNDFFVLLKEEAKLRKDLEEQAIRDFMAGKFDTDDDSIATDEDFDFGNEDDVEIEEIVGGGRKENRGRRFSVRKYEQCLESVEVEKDTKKLRSINSYLKTHKDGYYGTLKKFNLSRYYRLDALSKISTDQDVKNMCTLYCARFHNKATRVEVQLMHMHKDNNPYYKKQ